MAHLEEQNDVITLHAKRLNREFLVKRCWQVGAGCLAMAMVTGVVLAYFLELGR